MINAALQSLDEASLSANYFVRSEASSETSK